MKSVLIILVCLITGCYSEENEPKSSTLESLNASRCDLVNMTLNFEKLAPYLFRNDSTYIFTIMDSLGLPDNCDAALTHFDYKDYLNLDKKVREDNNTIRFIQIDHWADFGIISFEVGKGGETFTG